MLAYRWVLILLEMFAFRLRVAVFQLYYCHVTFYREIGTITYRSGPEWEERFGRKRIDDSDIISPNFCPEFEIESYLDYQVMNCNYEHGV